MSDHEPTVGWFQLRARRLIARVLQFRVVRTALRYTEHRGPALADSVTYRALFSVFAALLLGFSVAALWFGRDSAAFDALIEALDSTVPGLTDAVDLRQVEAFGGFTLVGVFSLIGLVGAAIGAIGSLRAAVRELADRVHDDLNPIWVLLRNLLLAIAFGGLLAAAAILSVLSSVGVQAVASWLGISAGDALSAWLTRGFGALGVLIINTAAIALVFRALSGVTAPARALWGGALLGGAGLLVLQELSGLFVRGATANPLLASFAALIALLLWFNLSAQVILFASTYIIVATDESRDRVRERFGATTMAQHRRRRAEDRVHAAARELRAAVQAETEEREGREARRS